MGTTMSKNSSSEWKAISKQLNALSSKELLKLIHELYQCTDSNRRFIAARFLKGEASLKKYKQQIHSALYPDFDAGKTDISISGAKKAISDFEKATHDSQQTLDLMIYFVEVGTQMIQAFGMDYESFYDSMESMFSKIVNRLKSKDRGLLPIFWGRLKKIETDSSDTGYGYGDSLADMMEELTEVHSNLGSGGAAK
ncbi:MAG: DUF6155 family protein [Bdellovibrionota bacterium]